MNKALGMDTLCVHNSPINLGSTAGVNMPIYTSSAYGYLETDMKLYPRYFNTPNQQSVASKIATLEGATSGLIFSSGMAAISTSILALNNKEDHIIFQPALYGGTYHFVINELENAGIQYSFASGLDVTAFEQQIRSNTRAIYIETPSNPLLTITDIKKITRLAKSKNLITFIDNTFATSINQKPIELGIDVVIHSATKYLGGHSDICAGAVATSEAMIKQIYRKALNLGGSLDANTCYLLERSIKTLAIRVERQNENAMKIAEYLQKHPAVNRVYYPGLPDHPDHEIACSQMTGFGGMLSFELNKIDQESLQKKLELIAPAMSLGGVESTICAPITTSHQHMPAAEREKQGINDRLLRLSVGIERSQDLIEDLDRALTS